MRRIVAKNKFNKNNRIYAYYGADGKMAILDTATLQEIASPMYVETAPIQNSAENAPVLVAETATLQPQISTLQPSPVLVAEALPPQTLQSAPVLVAEALPSPTPTPTSNVSVLPTITFSEPVTMATSTQQPTTQQTVTPTQSTVSTMPTPTIMPMPMGGGGGGIPPQSKVTTTTQTTPSGTVTKQTVVEPAKKEMSTGMKVGLGILVLVAGYMVFKNRKQIFG